MNFKRSTFCEVNLSALRFNLKQLQLKAGPTFLLPMIKANAYGHGSVAVAKVLEEEGIKQVGVALFEEGVALREAGIKTNILCFGGLLGASPQDFAHYQMSPVLFNRHDLELLLQNPVSLPIHIKVDTGMGRLGFFPAEIPSIIDRIRAYPHLKIQSVLTHLARADESDAQPSEEQINRFEMLRTNLVKQKIPIYHFANSVALIEERLHHSQWVRPGIALYGAYPHERLKEKIKLKPLLTWKSEVISIKKFEKGEALSYGGSFVCKRTSQIAVMAAGYADGFSRQFSNKGEVLLEGMRAPVVGRVCMDLTLLDVTDIPKVQLGSEVVILGKQDSQEITAEEMAEKINTISYEIFCGISSRVPRVYL